MIKKIYNKDNPPKYGELTVEEFKKLVDINSFPICVSCGQPIYNPDYYDLDMCGVCVTGEADEIMQHANSII